MVTAVSGPFRVQIVAASAGLPSWVPPPGTFAEFTTNKPADVGTSAATLANWCGGAMIEDYGPYGAVAYQGGGEHSVWNENLQDGVLLLNIHARAYERRCKPQVSHVGPVVGQNPTPPPAARYMGSPTGNYGEYLDDLSPQSKHTYNSLCWKPAAWGGSSRGSLVRVSHSGGLSKSLFDANGGTKYEQGYAATWEFKLDKATHTAADPSIFRLTGNQTYNYGSGTIALTNDAPCAGIDHIRKGWWSYPRDGSAAGVGAKIAFTAADGQITNEVGPSRGWTWGSVHHFADYDELVFLAGTLIPDITICNPGGAYTKAKLAGDWSQISDPTTGAYFGYLGFKWSTILECFVSLKPRGVPAGTCRILKVIPPPPGQRKTGDWRLEHEDLVAADGSQINVIQDAGSVNGIWGKLVECAPLRSLVWTRAANQKGQLLRPTGM